MPEWNWSWDCHLLDYGAARCFYLSPNSGSDTKPRTRACGHYAFGGLNLHLGLWRVFPLTLTRGTLDGSKPEKFFYPTQRSSYPLVIDKSLCVSQSNNQSALSSWPRELQTPAHSCGEGSSNDMLDSRNEVRCMPVYYIRVMRSCRQQMAVLYSQRDQKKSERILAERQLIFNIIYGSLKTRVRLLALSQHSLCLISRP